MIVAPFYIFSLYSISFYHIIQFDDIILRILLAFRRIIYKPDSTQSSKIPLFSGNISGYVYAAG